MKLTRGPPLDQMLHGETGWRRGKKVRNHFFQNCLMRFWGFPGPRSHRKCKFIEYSPCYIIGYSVYLWQMCHQCGCGEVWFRCRQCGPAEYLCTACDSTVHRMKPVHELELWNDQFWMSVAPWLHFETAVLLTKVKIVYTLTHITLCSVTCLFLSLVPRLSARTQTTRLGTRLCVSTLLSKVHSFQSFR